MDRRTVVLVTPTLVERDGVGNDVLGMARALRGRGHPVRLFAGFTDLPDGVEPIDTLDTLAGDDALIYHHSIGCPEGVTAIERWRGPCVVKYHNVTPPEFFADADAATAGRCRAGLDELPRLAATAARFWVDSPYNGRDLQARCPGVAFADLPPFHQAGEFPHVRPERRTIAAFDDWSTNLLCVGRLVPNKNLMLAIEAFAEFRARYDAFARLIVVGSAPLPAYAEQLRRRADELSLGESVAWTGPVTAGCLKALYLVARGLLVPSAHEGFCVPLLEAMQCRVPVVALRRAAVPDTAGPAAWFAADATPTVFAATIARMLGDDAEREAKLIAGAERYRREYAPERIERRFRELFDADLTTHLRRAA